MTIYYSPNTTGFYDTEAAHYAFLPEDKIEITSEKHLELLAAQRAGKVIGIDISGNPVAQDRVLTLEQQWVIHQGLARAELDKSDATMARIIEAVSLGLAELDQPDVAAWMEYRRALRDMLKVKDGIPGLMPEKPPYPSGT